MELAWYALLGLFLAGYLVLGGCDYGSGVLLARIARPAQRRIALNAVGPFFLGNEVWLVAGAGLLFGVFPTLEGELLTGLYPAVMLALVGVVTVTVSLPLRSRPATERARAVFDRLIIAGSTTAAAGWGAVLAGMLQGVPLRADGHLDGLGHLLTPFVAAGGMTVVALVAVHGAAFLALRMPASPPAAPPASPGQRPQAVVETAGLYERLGRQLVPVALAALAATTVVGLLSERVRQAVRQPAPAVLLLAVIAAALLVSRAALARRRPGVAFAATSVALATPVLLVGVAAWPYALVSSVDADASLTVTEAIASGPTLRLLGPLVVGLLPALLGFQLMSWWVFRGRIDGRAPVYW